MEVVEVLALGTVVPRVHDEHEDGGERDGDPAALWHLDDSGGEVEPFDGTEDEEEGERDEDALLPDKYDHQRHQTRRDEHHEYARNSWESLQNVR